MLTNKQRKHVIIGFIGLILLIIGGISFFVYNQSKKKHSITSKENSETPANKTSAKRIFANKLKADLQDALANDSRWKVEGISYYFQDYIEFGNQIIIHSENEDIKSELEQNWIRNAERRKKKREETKNSNKTSSEEEIKKYERLIVWADDLEPADYQEIINLIRQIRPLKEKKDQRKKFWVEEKLKSRPNLTYWSGTGKRNQSIDDNGKAWYRFSMWENDQEITMKIPENHPSLANFPFETEGFFLIRGIENLPMEVHRHWISKKISLNDKIEFIAYNS